MRKRVRHGGLTVQAIAGNHAVFLAFDLTDKARAGCLGFAIHREDHTESEAYWSAGFKTFRSVVPQPSSSVMYTTDQHPVQSMWWNDCTAKPGHDYTYQVVPLYGTPKNLVSKPSITATLDVSTSDPDTGTHGVYFNRGVAASQAYSAKFGQTPNNLSPVKRAEAMQWLSRGLHEALVRFITDGASSKVAIRAAVYEFTERSVLDAFSQAQAAGADVRIVYHAKGKQGAANDKAIANAGFDTSMLVERTHAPIAHNKFIVRAKRASNGKLTAEQVWTGSTNLSEGGIFGHSNVGHVVRDADVAERYLDYWGTVAGDPTVKPLATWVSKHSKFSAASVGKTGIHTLFSPRLELAPLDWYAQQFATATSSAHITLPFGMDNKHFEPELSNIPPNGPLHFVILDLHDDNQETWEQNHAIQVAVGSEGGPDSLSRWAHETLTGFNSHVDFLHTKILLVNPLSLRPTTISGSANFSEASTDSNDENMLVITGDRDTADVYFTEYARIFQHFYARWWAVHLDPAGADEHSFLTEDASWQQSYWASWSPKSFERDLFANGVKGNT